jgi:predicted nucleic acid-binding protein
MPEYMLDTDTVSFALRGQGRVGARLLEHRPSQLCIGSIALAALRFGAETRRSPRLLDTLMAAHALSRGLTIDARHEQHPALLPGGRTHGREPGVIRRA